VGGRPGLERAGDAAAGRVVADLVEAVEAHEPAPLRERLHHRGDRRLAEALKFAAEVRREFVGRATSGCEARQRHQHRHEVVRGLRRGLAALGRDAREQAARGPRVGQAQAAQQSRLAGARLPVEHDEAPLREHVTDGPRLRVLKSRTQARKDHGRRELELERRVAGPEARDHPHVERRQLLGELLAVGIDDVHRRSTIVATSPDCRKPRAVLSPR
jgi:hypothetical protein